MTIVDANLLLYVYQARSPKHAKAAKWFADLINSGEMVALPWVTVWAFIRISTNPRIVDPPLAPLQVFGIVDEWLSFSNVVLLETGPRHLEIMRRIVIEHNATGPLVTDAVLAALAIENGAVLASADQGFSRYKGLRWVNPLTA